MLRSTLTSKGQTTIPLQVREHLGLRQGDAIDFVVLADGSVVMRSAKRDVRSLEGLLKTADTAAVTLEGMKAAVRDTAARRDAASITSGTRGRPRRPRSRS
jgi:AbrB family looped-hinge helix DNA binding protein